MRRGTRRKHEGEGRKSLRRHERTRRIAGMGETGVFKLHTFAAARERLTTGTTVFRSSVNVKVIRGFVGNGSHSPPCTLYVSPKSGACACRQAGVVP